MKGQDDFWEKVDKTLCYHVARVKRGLRGMRWDLHRPLAQSPVFVVGCSRAGTTLVYRAFSESRELGSLKRETHDFWDSLHPIASRGWETHALTRADVKLRDREIISRYFFIYTGRRQFVDKNNQNGLCVPYLYALFPDARFVYVKRSPGDNINSLIEGWGKPDRFATWSGNLPAKVAIDKGQYRRWCFFLSEGWPDYCESAIEEVCAFQYRAMNQAILMARREIPQSQWTEIVYEHILEDPVGAFREALQSVGLGFDRHMDQYCRDVLANPYNAFSEIRKDKWKDSPNAQKIAQILPSVEGVARKMGYFS